MQRENTESPALQPSWEVQGCRALQQPWGSLPPLHGPQHPELSCWALTQPKNLKTLGKHSCFEPPSSVDVRLFSKHRDKRKWPQAGPGEVWIGNIFSLKKGLSSPGRSCPPSLEVFVAVVFRTWFSGGMDSAELVVWLNDARGLFQPQWLLWGGHIASISQ